MINKLKAGISAVLRFGLELLRWSTLDQSSVATAANAMLVFDISRECVGLRPVAWRVGRARALGGVNHYHDNPRPWLGSVLRFDARLSHHSRAESRQLSVGSGAIPSVPKGNRKLVQLAEWPIIPLVLVA